MKKAVLLLALVSNVWAAESSNTLTIGKYVTFGNDHSVSVVSSVAVAYSGSNTGTLVFPGCHKEKVATGEGFPYDVKYVAYTSRAEVASQVVGTNQVQLVDLDARLEDARQEVRKSVSFYCSTAEGVVVHLELKLENGETVKSQIFVQKDSDGLYVDAATGKKYLAEGPIDVLPSLTPNE